MSFQSTRVVAGLAIELTTYYRSQRQKRRSEREFTFPRAGDFCRMKRIALRHLAKTDHGIYSKMIHMSLLDVRNLTVDLPTAAGWIRPVNDVSFHLAPAGVAGSGRRIGQLQKRARAGADGIVEA